MKILEKLGTWAVLGLMSFNVVAMGCVLLLQKKLDGVREPVASVVGGRFPAFSGVELSGAMWEAGDAPCRVVRVTADNCAYCDRDKPSYETLLSAALLASCEIIELAPKAGQMSSAPRPGVVQIKFVDTDLGPVLAPFATPHTVILDRDWTIKWTRRGMFDQDSLADSVALLATFTTE